ncbi:MAG: hypothetical protein ACI306_04200 [Muribaculaceae bacterium]
MEKLLKYLMLLLVATFSLTFTACSDDDDEPNDNNLAGTSWQILSDSEDDELAGTVITFGKDGNCAFSPQQDWTYAKWSVSNDKLKIVLGEGEPDDYMEGDFVISGNNATYTYSWYDWDGKWGGEDTAVMKLQKK